MRLTLALFAISLVLVPAPTEAGDRELEIIFVNMTPDALSSDDSKKCARRLEGALKKEYATVKRFGETKTRKKVKKTEGESFMDWPAESYEPLKKGKDVWIDSVVLVDCQPEKKMLDVVMSPPSGGLQKIRLRGVAIDKKATAFVHKSIMNRIWNGFSP